jgi:IS30 family transposase
LRRRRRKYLKRDSKHCGRGMIKNRIGIEKRPKGVETKGSFGDLEVDTIYWEGPYRRHSKHEGPSFWNFENEENKN